MIVTYIYVNKLIKYISDRLLVVFPKSHETLLTCKTLKKEK